MKHLRMLAVSWLALFFVSMTARGQEPVMVGHYIDVGQGLSVLLEFPCGAVLIDTGGQDEEHLEYLHNYLADFFAKRADLNNTLNTMFITHPHLDHTRGIRVVTNVCRVKNYVDNGVTQGSGRAQVGWMRENAAKLGVKIREVHHDEIEALPNKNGLTDAAIDDVQCPACDPRIVVLSGGRRINPGWTASEFQNWNNHSLVVRVDFGKSSFLFTGDLETPAIEKFLSYYDGTKLLRANVYQVGHHGASNGTTPELAKAIAPDIAVIGVGKWDYGLEKKGFNTYFYGHPRRDVIDIFSERIQGSRTNPVTTKVFEGSQKPIDYTIRKRIYATGWDGDVKVSAKLDGSLSVLTRNESQAARPLAKSSPGKRWADELGQTYDSVTPAWVEPQCIPSANQGWDAPRAAACCCAEDDCRSPDARATDDLARSRRRRLL